MMKSIISLITICLFATACNFSAGTKKDLATGFSIKYNGFSVGEFGLVTNGKETKSNQVEMGQVIDIEVDNIQNYVEKDGRVFPGLDLRVVDKDGNVVLDGADILADANGFDPKNAAVLSGTITVGAPMKSGQTYHATMKIWDKQNPESEIFVEGDLVVK